MDKQERNEQLEQIVALLDRRSFLGVAGALVAYSALVGCGGASSATSGASSIPTTTGSNPQPQPVGPMAAATVTVSGTTVGTISPGFIGFSFEKDNMYYNPTLSGASPNMIALFKLLGPSVLRIGGTSQDWCTWTPSGAGLQSGQIAPADIDRVAAFLKATGWKLIYGLNLAQSPPALSAQEAVYATNAFGASLIGFEIGNEPDYYHDNPQYFASAATWTSAQWLSAFQATVTAIHAVLPNAPIVGPALGNHYDWLQSFVNAKIPNLALYTVHDYPGSSSSITGMLTYPSSGFVSAMGTVLSETSPSGIPYRVGECNSFAGGGVSGVSNSCASALWAVDFIFAAALAGASGVNLQLGSTSTSYTAITYGPDATGVQPEYYGLLLASLAGTGSVKLTSVSVTGLNISAFAVSTASGGMNVIINNKDASENISVTLAPGITVHSATLIVLTSPSLSALSGSTIQGASVSAAGTFTPAAGYTLSQSGNNVSCYVPAGSAVLIQIS